MLLRVGLLLLSMGCTDYKYVDRFLEPDVTSPKQDDAIPSRTCDDFEHGFAMQEYTGPLATMNVGECTPTTLICLDGVWYFKEFEVLPSPEICDFRDNDCDGETDNYLTDENVACGEFDPLLCARYVAKCNFGKMGCEEQFGPFPEICGDGIDQDCSGGDLACPPGGVFDTCDSVDNDLDGETDEQAEASIPCYTGPPYTIGVGECRSGIRLCLDGTHQEECSFEIVPTPESCMTATDLNCDGSSGIVSIEPDPDPKWDILIVVDVSGSMGDYIVDIQTSLTAFATAHATGGGVKMALITVGDEAPPNYKLRYDFGDAAGFNQELNGIYLQGSFEPAYDILLFALQPANPLGLSWTEDSTHLIMLFTDEAGQSDIGVTEFDVGDEMQLNPATIMVYGRYLEDFDDIVTDPSNLKDLTDPDLDLIITDSFEEACLFE